MRVGSCEAFGASYAAFTGQMQMEVEHSMNLETINSIELHSSLSAASGALAFTGAEAVSAIGVGSQAFIYTGNSTFCESATRDLNQD